MSIFGQNPADITGAIFKSKNFSDVPDKAAARTNLDVPSKAEVLYNSVPVGMILPYWGSVAPAGYLPCSGQTVTSGTFPELVTFLGGGSSQVVPDLRGEFLRGWDNSRGIDPGRTIGSWQKASTVAYDDSLTGASNDVLRGSASILGYDAYNNADYSGALSMSYATSVFSGLASAGAVRPRNVAVLYCIKAYSSVTNYTSSVNIAGLVSDYSTLSAAAVKYADFLGTNQIIGGSGYQKLPGGLIIQWGTVAFTTGTAGYTFALPIAFPTGGASLVAMHPGSTTTINITGGFASLGSLILYHNNSTNNTAVSWIATGY